MLAVVELAVFVHELRAVDQRNGLLPVQHCHGVQRWPLCKAGCQYIVGRVGSDRGRIDQCNVAQLSVRTSTAQLREYHNLPLTEYALCIGTEILHGLRIRMAQKITLPIADTQISKHPKVFFSLYALGHQRRAKDIRNLQQGLYGL